MNYHCIRYCLSRPIFLLCCALISFFLILVHQYRFYYSPDSHNSKLARRNVSFTENQLHSTRLQWKKENDADLSNQIADLILRIDDLKKIKLSVTNELRSIGQEKYKLLREKAAIASKNDKLIAQIGRSKAHLKQLELDISSSRRRKIEQTCDNSHTSPILFNPLKSLDINQQYPMNNRSHVIKNPLSESQTFQFDLSVCPLSKDFKFHYNHDQLDRSGDHDKSSYIAEEVIREVLLSHRQHTSNQDDACLIVVFSPPRVDSLSKFHKNILVINPSTKGIFTNNAAVAAPLFPPGDFRPHADVLIPSVWRLPQSYESVIGSIPPSSPIERKYLGSYFGKPVQVSRTYQDSSYIDQSLQVIHRNSIEDLFLFISDCSLKTNPQCFQEREKLMETSIFTMVFPTQQNEDYTSEIIYLALLKGSIPVIFGDWSSHKRILLPFDQVIDWRRAAIILPFARLPEIHFILRSIGAEDIYQLKYHGRRIFESYLATTKQIIDTIIGIMSIERFNYPPLPVQNIKTALYQPSKSIIGDTNCTSSACIEAKTESMASLLTQEVLGPREKPLASPSYIRNYSLILNSAYDVWNNPMFSPMFMFPSHPLDPVAPSEYKYYASDKGYRPIANGLGGSGVEFSRALGGDKPNEQFTIILLTYERNALLMKTLERLKGLPYLNKIIIVWNSLEHKPEPDMIWPDVGAPIALVRVDRNSLNNRFLPYDEIETDAILSLDDDSPLRADEIIFAFRVWRQSRERIVGFPGRYHAWDSLQNTWLYNSNHSCELSMVLTGGAFFHRYYSYAYTYDMPQVIRDIVDKFMNCEDIAMNFLVAHLTRKPPVKVTSRWTFHCAGCDSSLSEDDSHFRERHECLNTFTAIYGYMPLLSTQHRSDSILFKTRLPHDKQKCFKYV